MSRETAGLSNEDPASVKPENRPSLSVDIEAVTRRNTRFNKDMVHLDELTGERRTERGIDDISKDVQTPKQNGANRFVAKLAKIRGWSMTREPSGQAFEEYRMAEFKKAKVDFNDSNAATKFHVATAKVPSSTIKPGGWVSSPRTPRKPR